MADFLLCERAARDVRVLYSGQGGDELFGGYERLAIFAALTEGAETWNDEAYRPLFERMRRARAQESDDPLASYRAAVRRSGRLGELGNDRARALLAAAPKLEDMLRHGGEEAPRDPEALVAAYEWRVLLPGLLQVDDRCSASFGLEGRSIFLDQLLAAELLAVPYRKKSAADAPRALFRRLLGDLVPAELLEPRPKLGFPVPLAVWWRGSLREFAGDRLLAAAARDRGFVPADRVDEVLADDGQGGRLVYFLLMLDLWLESLAGSSGDRRSPSEELV